MKVIHFFARFPNETQPYNKILLERLIAHGIQCEVASLVAGNGSSRLKIHNLFHTKIKWVNYLIFVAKYRTLFLKYRKESQMGLLKSIKLFGKYAPLIQARPDVVHIHHVQILNDKLLTFLNSCNFKTLISFRGSDILVRPYRNEREKAFLKNALKRTQGAHAVSGNIAKIIESFGKSPDDIYSIYRTVEVDKKSFIKKSSLIDNHLHITTIGRIHWTKGYTDAIKALKVLKDHKIDFTYNICGGYDMEDFDELNFWIRKLDLEENITFHGYLNNDGINEVLGRTNIYLQCSLTEGIPNTLLRIMYYQIPAVTTNAGGIPEVFKEPENGIMVEVGDIHAISDALMKLNRRNDSEKAYKNPTPVDFAIEMEAYRSMYMQIMAKGK